MFVPVRILLVLGVTLGDVAWAAGVTGRAKAGAKEKAAAAKAKGKPNAKPKPKGAARDLEILRDALMGTDFAASKTQATDQAKQLLATHNGNFWEALGELATEGEGVRTLREVLEQGEFANNREGAATRATELLKAANWNVEEALRLSLPGGAESASSSSSAASSNRAASSGATRSSAEMGTEGEGARPPMVEVVENPGSGACLFQALANQWMHSPGITADFRQRAEWRTGTTLQTGKAFRALAVKLLAEQQPEFWETRAATYQKELRDKPVDQRHTTEPGAVCAFLGRQQQKRTNIDSGKWEQECIAKLLAGKKGLFTPADMVDYMKDDLSYGTEFELGLLQQHLNINVVMWELTEEWPGAEELSQLTEYFKKSPHYSGREAYPGVKLARNRIVCPRGNKGERGHTVNLLSLGNHFASIYVPARSGV